VRNPKELTIEKIILHILDPRDRGLIRSKHPLPPDSDSRIFNYFKGHIQKSLADEDARAARFDDLTSDVANACHRLLRSGTNDKAFVDGSRDLAKSLYDIMEKNRSISRGDLVVCRYQAKEGDSATPTTYLGLLKIDPAEVFHHVEERDAKGRLLYVGLEVDPEGLPTAGERLQKCAFVRPLQPRHPDYDLILLDRQVRPTEGPEVAFFFSRGFLSASLQLTSMQATRLFIRQTAAGSKLLRQRQSNKQQKQLDKSVDTALRSKEVHVDKWVQELDLPTEQKEVLKGRLSDKYLPDRKFQPNKKVVQEFRKKAKEEFEGDYGLRLIVPSKVPRNRIEDKKNVQGPGGKTFKHAVTLYTDKWEKSA